MKQIAILDSNILRTIQFKTDNRSLSEWIYKRVVELCFVSSDLKNIINPNDIYSWDIERRFEIRCELDALLFHLYFITDEKNNWCIGQNETIGQLNDLILHFPKPRDAVNFIMDQFPIVRQKDEAAYGCYRTKERILEIYDAMAKAKAEGGQYQTSLNPPPGER